MGLEVMLCSCPREVASGLARKVVEEGYARCAYTLPAGRALVGDRPGEFAADRALLLVPHPEEAQDDMHEFVREQLESGLRVIVYLTVEEVYGPFLEWLEGYEE